MLRTLLLTIAAASLAAPSAISAANTTASIGGVDLQVEAWGRHLTTQIETLRFCRDSNRRGDCVGTIILTTEGTKIVGYLDESEIGGRVSGFDTGRDFKIFPISAFGVVNTFRENGKLIDLIPREDPRYGVYALRFLMHYADGEMSHT